MAIVAADFQFRFSGGAANSDPNASLGGVKSANQLTDASLHNLFDEVSGAEASSGDTEYRGIYYHNAHATLSLQSAVVWISTESSSTDSNLDLALAGEGLNGTMETVANESTAPVGEVFTHPITEGTGLSLGTVPAGQHYGIWIRRVIAAAAAAFNTDTAVITVKGQTAA